MDTFSKFDEINNSVVVWPRDILHRELNYRARIMTFDYTRIYDRASVNDDPDEWAEDLLRQLERVRDVGMVRVDRMSEDY